MLALPAALASAPLPAHALDGCLVLLCLAAPSWGAIPQCVPPIRQLFRDLALGRAFPVCGMSGPANTAQHQWSSAPGFCPPQYVYLIPNEVTTTYGCEFAGAVSVVIDDAPWSRTWWSFGGRTVTDFLPAAKAMLGQWDTTFDEDYDAWVRAQPAPLTPADPGGA